MTNLLKYKDFCGTVEYSADDDLLYGQVIGINGLISYEGDSLASLKNDFENAVDDYLEMCLAAGVMPEHSYKGDINVHISPELHRNLLSFAASHNQSVNMAVENAIKAYVAIN